jgi:hypothetical protein
MPQTAQSNRPIFAVVIELPLSKMKQSALIVRLDGRVGPLR